ncbi:MAG: TatD family deoxyribonuclease [Cytophagia bacterium]|nr:TatD family deoxyribonuclease [Cytophagia bacterium]
MIDTHAHIYLDEFKDDRSAILDRARERGVQKILMPNIDSTSIDNLLDLEAAAPELCVAMMGLHPCYVKKGFEKDLYEVEAWLGKKKFCAVGEIGTDLYWDKSLWAEQQEAFQVQLNLAKQYALPVSIHSRESTTEALAIIEKLQDGKLSGVFHCYSGTIAQAEQAIKLGFHLGIGGVATFKKGELDDLLKTIDLKYLVLETDSPYLAPVPYRGKRNEPAYLHYVAEKIAVVKNLPVEEVITQTTSTAKAIFTV